MEISPLSKTNTCCKICNSSDLRLILDLGIQPPANDLKPLDHQIEHNWFPLKLYYCTACQTAQLSEIVNPQYLFNNYIWVTGTSTTAVQHSYNFVTQVLNRAKKDNPYVFEIASNDGTFLKRFQDAGCKVLGVDPASNIARVANNLGIDTVESFFDHSVAKHLVEKSGFVDILIARNVLPHVEAIHSFLMGIQYILDRDGIGVIEFHDARIIVEQLHYDSIYHEHLYYFTVSTLISLLSRFELYAFDILPSPISGGSWIVFISHNKLPKTQALSNIENEEATIGINSLERWIHFANDANKHSIDLKRIVCDSGPNLYAYGASARSSTLLNYCGLGSDHITAVIDKNPLKHGLYTPGSGIPVISLEQSLKTLPYIENMLLLAWNFKEEIIRELRQHLYSGSFIIPLPNGTHIV